jgi:lathosterol oxidase
MPIATQVVFLASLVLILLERVPRLRRVPLPLLRPHALTDALFLLIGYVAGANLALAWVHWGTDALRAAGVPAIGGTTPVWLEVLVAVALLDLGNYLSHWLLHRVDFLWRIHQVHHSSPKLDWLATFRSHLLEQLLRRLLAPLLLIGLGVSVPAVGIASGVLLGWAVFNHANVRIDLRVLEPLFITPRLHHLHHVPATSLRNLGTVLSVWDRLFGRLELRDVPANTGLGAPGARPGYPQTFGALLLEPFAPAFIHRSSSVQDPAV